MGRELVDTSVLIAYSDVADKHHGQARDELARLRDEGEAMISVVTYSEILVGAFRSQTHVSVERLLKRFPITLWPVTPSVAIAAARLRVEHPRLKLPDALIIATATTIGADALLTADRSWPGISPLARVIQA